MAFSEHPLLKNLPDRVIHISQMELGIGDILCSLYGLNAFSQKHGKPPIALHMRDHMEWVSLVDIPNLEVFQSLNLKPETIDLVLGDSETDYREKLRGEHDPKEWYANKLGVKPVKPALNTSLYDHPLEEFQKPYVIFSPFATRINRTWEVHNWRILADGLKAAGYEPIALDAPHQPDRCGKIGIRYFWGQKIKWVANACKHADLIITGDSSFAHIGGLLGVKTIVIMTQQNPKKYFSMTSNHIIKPDFPCVGCRFQPDRGYEEKCDFGCWALQSISPKQVLRDALDLLSARH